MHRRTLLKAGLLAPAAALPLAGTPVSAAEARPRLGRTLARGLSFPWGIDFLPGGDALVSERNSGRVLRVRPQGGYRTVGRITGVFNNGGEGGLMGVALAPDFSRTRWVYLFLTTTVDNRVIRVRYSGGRLHSREPVLTGIPRNQRHNGGGLWFGPGPSLFVTTGDSQRAELAQDLSSLAGKILRVRPDGRAQAGNPFVGRAGDDRIWTYGHRNPEGITIGPGGKVWSSELGENTWDELNHVLPGRNYGWPHVEGRGSDRRFANPFAQWHPDVCSPSGVAIVAGHAWVGALRGQSLWSVDLRTRARSRWYDGRLGRIRMVTKAPDGSLWVGTSNGGGRDGIHRVVVG